MRNTFLSLILIIVYSGCIQTAKSNLEKTIGVLPEFKFIALQNLDTTSSSVFAKKTSLLIMYFRPDCEHCQAETKKIRDNIDHINYKILLLTPASKAEAKAFATSLSLENNPKITIATDYKYNFLNLYRPKGVPYVVIYDKQNNLKSIYEGEVDLDKILEL